MLMLPSSIGNLMKSDSRYQLNTKFMGKPMIWRSKFYIKTYMIELVSVIIIKLEG